MSRNTKTLLKYPHYYPFGLMMPGRSWSDGYRFGFNGKELDEDGIGGNGSTYDYGFRIYNPAIAKFLSVDPLMDQFPELSVYQYASNTPIWAIDIDGLESWKSTNDPDDVMSFDGWKRFVVTELKRMESTGVMMDCADVWLYLIAKYHMINEVELNYFHPIAEIWVSSSDPNWGNLDEASFENFVWGMSNDQLKNLSKKSQIFKDGLLASFSNFNIEQDTKNERHLATQLTDNSQVMVGDGLYTIIHMSISLKGVDLPSSDGLEPTNNNQMLYATGSGHYFGKGEGNSTTGAPNTTPVTFDYGYGNYDQFSVFRPTFVMNLNNNSQPQTINPVETKSINMNSDSTLQPFKQ